MSITANCIGTLGRLGNSLFQIASCIGIADTLKTDVIFPQWKYSRYFKHPLPTGFITSEKINETNFHYDEQLINSLNPGKDYNLYGYFQSEKYWLHCKEKVLQQFTFNDETKLKVKHRFKMPLGRPHVAISVRRGDFVNNSNYFQLPITYYLNAYYKYFEGYNIIICSDDFS